MQVDGPGIAPAVGQKCVVAAAAGGTPPEPAAQSPLSVKITVPPQKNVGESAIFVIEVRNIGTATLKKCFGCDPMGSDPEPRQSDRGQRAGSRIRSLEGLGCGLEPGKATE